MSFTPVFDATVRASDPDIHLTSQIVFPQPSTPIGPEDAGYSEWLTISPNPVDSRARTPWLLTIKTPKPEPKWRTFLRCLLWWLP